MQELRLVIGVGPLRGDNLAVRRSDIPDRKIRNRRRIRISPSIIFGRYEEAPGSSNVVCLAVRDALAQLVLDPIENVLGKLLRVVEELFHCFVYN